MDIAFKQSQRLTIVGASGFGKTETAIEYAYRHASNTEIAKEYDCTWLVNAQSALELEKSYRDFAFRIKMPNAGADDFSLVIRDVKLWLLENSKYLFIFDNTEGLSENLLEFLPEGQLLGHLIFTTWDEKCVIGKRIDLGVFLPEESSDFLKARCKDSKHSISDDEARELGSLLGNLPLALEHAAAYILAAEMECTSYIAKLKNTV